MRSLASARPSNVRSVQYGTQRFGEHVQWQVWYVRSALVNTCNGRYGTQRFGEHVQW